jgi:hypothetical protein
MSRLVQVRGASGSGKSTLVRNIIGEIGPAVRWKIAGRQRPIALTFPNHQLCIVGHYDVTCGGCDTIKSRSQPYEVAQKALSLGFNVLMEGLFMAVELHRTVELERFCGANGHERHDVFIDQPLEHCVLSVNARRAAEGRPPKEMRQMEAFHKRIMQTEARLRGAGLGNIHIYGGSDPHFNRALAADHVRSLLDLPSADFILE